jgi:hypothetical protein
MPNWKKVIVSGSDASLNSLEVNHASGSFSGSFQGDGSGITGINASAVGFSNNITLSADYTTVAGTYNSLHGPLALEADVTISVTEGSFLKIEDFDEEILYSVSSSFAETSSYALVASQSVNNNASSGSLSFWQGSQAEYDLISASADLNTVYFIT